MQERYRRKPKKQQVKITQKCDAQCFFLFRRYRESISSTVWTDGSNLIGQSVKNGIIGEFLLHDYAPLP